MPPLGGIGHTVKGQKRLWPKEMVLALVGDLV